MKLYDQPTSNETTYNNFDQDTNPNKRHHFTEEVELVLKIFCLG